MARATTGWDAAWMHHPNLAVDRKRPRRKFWSGWMTRALAPHERAMAAPHQPIAILDLEPAASEGELPLGCT